MVMSSQVKSVGSEERCRLFSLQSGSDLKYSSQGFNSIYQHSNKPKYKSLSNICFWKQLQEICYRRYYSFCGQNFTIIIIPKPPHQIWSHFKRKSCSFRSTMGIWSCTGWLEPQSMWWNNLFGVSKNVFWLKCGKITYYE